MKRNHSVFIQNFDKDQMLYFKVRSGIEESYCDWSDLMLYDPGITNLEEQDIQVYNKKLVAFQHFPNPFNEKVTVQFQLSQSAHVNLEIYNVLGQKIKELANSTLNQGEHQYSWYGKNHNGQNMPTGVYFYKLSLKDEEKIQKILLVR